MMASQSTNREKSLLAALRRLPDHRWDEVRDFIEFIAAREAQEAEEESKELSLDNSIRRQIEQGRAELAEGEEIAWEEIGEDA